MPDDDEFADWLDQRAATNSDPSEAERQRLHARLYRLDPKARLQALIFLSGYTPNGIKAALQEISMSCHA